MGDIEWRAITPEEFTRDIEDYIRRSRENKYAFQVGLKYVDFDIDQERLDTLGLALPFHSIAQAESALTDGLVHPAKFLEVDDTEHQVLVFDPRPVGYSGFMDCVTHSLALTDQGLFEVGRYPAVSLSESNKYWQWFLHRRLATQEEIANLQEETSLASQELIERVYQAMVQF